MKKTLWTLRFPLFMRSVLCAVCERAAHLHGNENNRHEPAVRSATAAWATVAHDIFAKQDKKKIPSKITTTNKRQQLSTNRHSVLCGFGCVRHLLSNKATVGHTTHDRYWIGYIFFLQIWASKMLADQTHTHTQSFDFRAEWIVRWIESNTLETSTTSRWRDKSAELTWD